MKRTSIYLCLGPGTLLESYMKHIVGMDTIEVERRNDTTFGGRVVCELFVNVAVTEAEKGDLNNLCRALVRFAGRE